MQDACPGPVPGLFCGMPYLWQSLALRPRYAIATPADRSDAVLGESSSSLGESRCGGHQLAIESFKRSYPVGGKARRVWRAAAVQPLGAERAGRPTEAPPSCGSTPTHTDPRAKL